MKTILFLLFPLALLFPLVLFGQYDSKETEYEHYKIIENKDTIYYHVYKSKNVKEIAGFVIYFQGSGPRPFFQITSKTDTIKTTVNGIVEKKISERKKTRSTIPFNLDQIPQNFAFVVISKKGVPFIVYSNKFKAGKTYYENEGLDYRVWQGNKVINDLIVKNKDKTKKVIVIGHSEGSDVVAKLGTINKKITHIGFWSGGGNTQYFDFAIFARREVQKGNITEKQCKIKIDSLFAKMKDIQENENSIVDFWEGNSYRRWSKYSEPAINNLLKIKIPIFVAAGGKDESVPIESAYLIPIEFIRNRKENLTFKVYPEYDHSFIIWNKDNEPEFHWMEVFEEFMKWTNQDK